MDATVQHDIPQRIVTNRGIAAYFVLSSAWTVYLRVRHVSARSKVPEYFFAPRVLHGSAGLALDLLMCAGIVIVMLGVFGSTRDRMERIGIVACLASLIIKPLQMLFPTYAAAMWWVNLGCIVTFLGASVAVLLRLNRAGAAQATSSIRPPAPGLEPAT